MPLSKQAYEDARRRANDRIRKWIADLNAEKERGIPKLRKEYKHVFKTIEWTGRGKKDVKQDSSIDSVSSSESEDLEIKMCQGCGSGKDGRRTLMTGMSAVLLEDNRIHDSNSSNLSSAHGQVKEEIRYSESRTPNSRNPYSHTPLLLVESENKDKPKSSKRKSLNPLVQYPSTSRNRQSSIAILLPNGLNKPRRRKARARNQRHAREKDVSMPNDDFTIEMEETEDVSEMAGKAQEREGAFGTVGGPGDTQFPPSCQLSARPSMHKASVLSIGPGTQKGKLGTKGGKLEGGKRHRTDRLHRHRVAVSKMELPVVKMSTEEKHKEVLANFRRMVRLLIHVRVLLNVSRIRIEEEEKSKEFKRFDDGKEISFDPTAFKSALTYSGLTARARKVLKKNPADRTEDDARILMEVMVRLPVFNKYPKSVKQGLAKTMWYDMFQDGRVIVKQGDPGSRMYFVVSGEVDLHRTDDINTGEVISYHIRTLTAGSTFGELALIRNIRREFTAVCKGTSEFLSLSKDEFNQALRSRWERDCNLRFRFLRDCDHFKDWTDKQLQICADSSELKEYKNNTVIIGDTDGPGDSVFFVRKGRCEIVRRIVVVRHQSPYLRPNILLPAVANRRTNFLDKPYTRNKRVKREEVRFLTVTTLQPGNYFGAGENLRDTFILSRGKTDCVLINAAQFSIQGKSEQLRRMQSDRDKSIPPNKVLYDSFQGNRKWYEYRNKLVHDIVERKEHPHIGCRKDVPQSVLNLPTIPKDLIHYKRLPKAI